MTDLYKLVSNEIADTLSLFVDNCWKEVASYEEAIHIASGLLPRTTEFNENGEEVVYYIG